MIRFFFVGKPLGYGTFFWFLSSFLRFFGKKKWTRTHVLKSKAEQKAEQKSRNIFRKNVVVSCHFIFSCNNKYTGHRPSISSAKDCPVDIPRRHLDVSWTTPRRIQSRLTTGFAAFQRCGRKPNLRVSWRTRTRGGSRTPPWIFAQNGRPSAVPC